MGSEHTFDIVSNVDLQELRNAVSQAQKELATRFDFRGSSASVSFDEPSSTIKLAADHQAQLNSVRDVLETKMAKRGVSVRALAWQAEELLPSGGVKRSATLQQGLSSDNAKDIVKTINTLGLKVQPRIDGESVRVAGKQVDELQAVIQTLKSKDFGVPLQFDNYR